MQQLLTGRLVVSVTPATAKKFHKRCKTKGSTASVEMRKMIADFNKKESADGK